MTTLPYADPHPAPSRGRRIVGWIISAVPSAMILMGGIVDLLQLDFAKQGLTEAGYHESIMVPIGIVMVASVILYLIPRTAALGAILLTAYMGGAVATHGVMKDPFYMMIPAIVVGALVWLGLVLRDARFRAVLPW